MKKDIVELRDELPNEGSQFHSRDFPKSVAKIVDGLLELGETLEHFYYPRHSTQRLPGPMDSATSKLPCACRIQTMNVKPGQKMQVILNR